MYKVVQLLTVWQLSHSYLPDLRQPWPLDVSFKPFWAKHRRSHAVYIIPMPLHVSMKLAPTVDSKHIRLCTQQSLNHEHFRECLFGYYKCKVCWSNGKCIHSTKMLPIKLTRQNTWLLAGSLHFPLTPTQLLRPSIVQTHILCSGWLSLYILHSEKVSLYNWGEPERAPH